MSVSRVTSINGQPLCHCGKLPCRPGQRNCLECAAKANKAYRQRQADKHAAAARLAVAGIAARAREG